MSSPISENIPLAERMRPARIEDFVGQEELLGAGRILDRLIVQKKIPSLLLWGPPGSGKTTLAKILAQNMSADFVFFSAVLSGVKEVREIVARAKELKNKDKTAVIENRRFGAVDFSLIAQKSFSGR